MKIKLNKKIFITLTLIPFLTFCQSNVNNQKLTVSSASIKPPQSIIFYLFLLTILDQKLILMVNLK